jgi:hypothetical protein
MLVGMGMGMGLRLRLRLRKKMGSEFGNYLALRLFPVRHPFGEFLSCPAKFPHRQSSRFLPIHQCVVLT